MQGEIWEKRGDYKNGSEMRERKENNWRLSGKMITGMDSEESVNWIDWVIKESQDTM